MKDIHTVVRGNATEGASSRKSVDGKPSASVRVAVTSSYRDPESGDWVDRDTEYLTVFCRGQLATNVAGCVRKGDALMISGRLYTSQWTDQDGKDRFSLTMQAEAIGHDLNAGTVGPFLRPARDRDVPDMHPTTQRPIDSDDEPTADPETGEIAGSEQTERELVDAPF
ncbi:MULTISPECIES: single-stranded DNA-binding protein [unclassified Brachybacterium]|uniref:single-stranded DNA-binding protein n=1 Tax=unclassified Brachybacterium TaxID=2623841 RepID=UPI001304480E|nr:MULTISPECIES: single-stranded DNA-binding protein [unclassified Brachybacterium]